MPCLILLLAAGCYHVPAPPAGFARDWGEQQIFDYNGIKINYYEAGQGPPVILLHGFGASAYSWRHLIPALAGEHRVFTLDLKGFGLSDKPADGKYALTDQADLVAAFIRARDLRDLALIGNSMGGGIAVITYLKLEDTDPGRIRRLVLIDSAGYPQKLPWFIAMARVPGLNTIATRLLSPRFATALVLRRCYYDKEKITEEQIDTYAYFGSLPGAAPAVIQTAKQILPPNIDELTARYKIISVPVLLIWGEDDRVVPLDVGRSFKRDLPNSELIILPRCGHIPQEEEPGETNRLVTSFLQGHR